MALDPPLRRLLALSDQAPLVPLDLNERRRQANAAMMLLHPGPQRGVRTEDHSIAVEGGAILVRASRPEDLEVPSPTLFFIHGGGWFQGDLETGEVESGPMASTVPCLVISVAYRLAPEHKYPTPLHDCVAAYKWMLSEAEELGVDTSRIAVAGTSAGGNLAASLLLIARDEGLTMPILQVLESPALDLTLSSPSVDEVGSGYGLTRESVDEFIRFYTDGVVERSHPLVSPLLAPDVASLPPALIFVAELDPVRDDGERWLAKLHEAGIPAACFRVLGQFHAGWIVPITTTSRLVGDVKASALRRAFAGSLVPGSPW